MANDPYRYFRVEARELLDGLTEGVLALERGGVEVDRVNSLLRLAHTLKGAARVVKQPAIAELAHGLEDMLAPFREGAAAAAGEQTRLMLQALDRIGAGLAALGPSSAQSAATASQAAVAEPIETVRVDMEDVETLLGRLSEIGAELAAIEGPAEMLKSASRNASVLLQEMQSLPEDHSARVFTLAGQLHDSLQALERRLGEAVERMTRELSQASEAASRLRLLSSAAIFPALRRAAHDAAAALGKSVQIETAGGEIRLDAPVLMLLRDALVQLVRNAVAHGIEHGAGRAAAGKPQAGRVDLTIERRGDRVAFLCRDDGAGLDLAAIRRVALEKGMVSAADAGRLELAEAIDLIFRGGLSTSGQVNQISGRGIGLDIVRAAVTRLKGEISVETVPGRGVAVEICVPASLTSAAALMVGTDGAVAGLPLECVRQTLRIDDGEIARAGEQESIAFEGQAIPFLRLSSALSAREESATPSGRCTIVIVSSGTRLAAIGVDRLMGTANVLVRALPALAPATRVVNGATLDSQGNPRLFLDPAGLVQAARNGRRRLAPRNRTEAPILIVDDSLTSRMVEQSILESAGYRVDLAISGEQGLEMALARRYGLFLVDVEMPGINGFEFLSRTRADAALRDIPAILITSRMSGEDRRRGKAAGARAYIVKSEFDQRHFLEIVQQLVG